MHRTKIHKMLSFIGLNLHKAFCKQNILPSTTIFTRIFQWIVSFWCKCEPVEEISTSNVLESESLGLSDEDDDDNTTGTITPKPKPSKQPAWLPHHPTQPLTRLIDASLDEFIVKNQTICRSLLARKHLHRQRVWTTVKFLVLDYERDCLMNKYNLVDLQSACRRHLALRRVGNQRWLIRSCSWQSQFDLPEALGAVLRRNQIRELFLKYMSIRNKNVEQLRARSARTIQKHWKSYQAAKTIEKQTPTKTFDNINTKIFVPLGAGAVDCSCWALKNSILTRGSITIVERTLIFEKQDRGLLQPHVLENGEEAYVSEVVAGKRTIYHKIQHKGLCAGDLWEVGTLIDCHLGSGSDLFSGHNYIRLAQLNVVGSRTSTLALFSKDFPTSFRVGLESETDFGCLCQTPMPKFRASAPGYVRLQDRQSLKITKTMENQNLKNISQDYAYLLSCHINSILSQFGNRVVPSFFHTEVKNAWLAWHAPFSDTADDSLTWSYDDQIPRCLRNRLKTIRGKIDRAARTAGVKTWQPAKTGADSAQESREIRRDRYALSHDLSRSELVASMSQEAQYWLKTARAQHLLNQVVRTWPKSQKEALNLYDKFNDNLVKYHNGIRLPLPMHQIDSYVKQLERSDALKWQQKEATRKRDELQQGC